MQAQTIPVAADVTLNVVMIDGHLGLHVLKHGVQVFRVVLLDAMHDMPRSQLAQYASVAPDLAFTVGNVFERIETRQPQ